MVISPLPLRGVPPRRGDEVILRITDRLLSTGLLRSAIAPLAMTVSNPLTKNVKCDSVVY